MSRDLLKDFPYFKEDLVDNRQLLLDLGPTHVHQWLEQRNDEDKVNHLERSKDPDFVAKEDLGPFDTDFGILFHTIAGSDADKLLKGWATYGDFATSVMSLRGFTIAALISEDVLRAYIYHLVANIGWGITDEREGIADRLIEMYRRRLGVPRELSQEQIFDWWDFWQDQGVTYPYS